jgi:hypothetical protein
MMSEDADRASGEPQGEQAASSMEPTDKTIDRRKGFKLDHVLRRELPREEVRHRLVAEDEVAEDEEE